MLSKFAHVTKEGKYVKPPHAKMSYGGVSTEFSPFFQYRVMLIRCYTFALRELTPTYLFQLL